jgi:hypothetical protein
MIQALRRQLPLAVLLCWSSSALAATDVTVTPVDAKYDKLSKYDCENHGTDEIKFSYTFTYAASQTVEYFLATDSGCVAPQGGAINTGTTLSTTSALSQTISPRTAPTGSTGISYSDTTTQLTVGGVWNWYADYKSNANGTTALSYKPTPDATKCLADLNNVSVYLCVLVSTPDTTVTGGTAYHSGALAIALSSRAPDAPSAPAVDALDSALKVTWSSVTTPITATRYNVHVQDPATKMDVKTTQVTNGQLTATMTGLTNGTTYDVFVEALDDAGTDPPTTSNVSAPSSTVQGSPIPSISYFEEYRHDGGTERGGCSTGGQAGLALLLLPLLFWRRRRAGVVALGLLLVASTARAEMSENDPNAPIVRQPSPEFFRVEIQTGPFGPNLDKGLSARPYKQVFGTKTPLLTRLSLHVNFFGGFGHASLGAALGIWQNSGHALKEDRVSAAGDTEALSLYTMTPVLGYRADFIYTKWKVPLVPFAKVGYGFTYFSDTKSGKNTSGTDPATGQKWHSYGWASGLEWAAGLEFPLDFFDQRRASNLDEEFGINSTGIYGEYSSSDWKGLHGGLPLGGGTWSGGLYLAF